MTTTLTPDICVIGAGSAGLSVAAGAAQLGAETVLIEAHKMGGDCLNYGCVPSKALLAAAHAAEAQRRAGRFGVQANEPAIDFRAVHDHVHGVIAAIAPQDSEERFSGLGVRVLRAQARFSGPREVAAGDFRIRARRFVIATGSTAAGAAAARPRARALSHERDGLRSGRAAAPSAGHRRRPDRRRAGAGLPPARRRGLARRDGDAAAEGRSGAGAGRPPAPAR